MHIFLRIFRIALPNVQTLSNPSVESVSARDVILAARHFDPSNELLTNNRIEH